MFHTSRATGTQIGDQPRLPCILNAALEPQVQTGLLSGSGRMPSTAPGLPLGRTRPGAVSALYTDLTALSLPAGSSLLADKGPSSDVASFHTDFQETQSLPAGVIS